VDEESPRKSGPRAHHHSPQCWLAGFTDSGEKDGRLFVTDLKRRKQWGTSPPNAGHIRDFYRVSDSDLPPLFFENAFGQIESILGPIFKSLYGSPRQPNEEELTAVLHFIALQHARTPAFRPWFMELNDRIYRSFISESLKSRKTWERFLKQADVPLDSPGADYEGMLKFQKEVVETGRYTMTAGNEFYLVHGFRMAINTALPLLSQRFWGALISPSGSFIGSDAPVVMDGPKGVMIGFKSAEVIFFPINRFILLVGTRLRVKQQFVTRRLIAYHNTFMMLTADQQLYSHVPDFCWLDETRRVRDDWESFSRENVLDSVEA
jgi:hypothetical protein